MARYCSIATGNWSSLATWGAVRNTPTVHASTNLTITGSASYSAYFTAPNTTNYVQGVEVFFPNVGTAGTITFTLWESGVAVATTAAISLTSISLGSYLYFPLSVPYRYTTTTASAYRWSAATSGASGTTQLAADSGGTLFSYKSVDDLVSAAPTISDQVDVTSDGTTTVTVTVDNTSAQAGGSLSSGTTPGNRTVSSGLYISGAGKVYHSRTASSTLTCRGHVTMARGGIYDNGTTGDEIPSSYIGKLVVDQNGTDNAFDFEHNVGATTSFCGAVRTATKFDYVSGDGTTATPLVISTTNDLAVGDRIAIAGGAYNEYEEKYIRTVVSSTSFTLADTAGGAESGFTYTHTANHPIILTSYNAKIATTTANDTFAVINRETTDATHFVWKYAEADYVGGTAVLKRGFMASRDGAAQASTISHLCVYRANGWGFSYTSSTTEETASHVYTFINSMASNIGAITFSNCKNKTLEYFVAIGCVYNGFYFSAPANLTLNYCEAWNNNSANNANAGGFRLDNTTTVYFNNCSAQGNRFAGFKTITAANISISNSHSGDYAANDYDFALHADTYNEITCTDTFLQSTSRVYNYLNTVPGTKVKLHRIDQTDWYHESYTAYGVMYPSGPSCSDTNTIQTGHHSVKLAPEDTVVGRSFEFGIYAKAGDYVSVQGFVQMNSAFYGDSGASVVVNLFLPGSTTADATYTIPKDGNDNPFNIGATFSGSVDGIAVVKITAKSATAGAYAYAGKLYNGSNALTALDVWKDAEPSYLIYPQLGDPASVWSVATAPYTISGTFGYVVNRIYTILRGILMKW